jgi:hypothetical protein
MAEPAGGYLVAVARGRKQTATTIGASMATTKGTTANAAERTAAELLRCCPQTYAAQAGIRLADKPAPLYQLLVLSVLLSTRIKAELAVEAARQLRAAGMSSPQKMREAAWQERVDALGRAHYKRYDEQTATALGQGAELLTEQYGGDLRKLRDRAQRTPAGIRKMLKDVPRLGPVGADIFCREAQLVWPELRPYFDKKALSGAARLGLPGSPGELAGLVAGDDLALLAAGLVRADLDRSLPERLRAQPRSG